MVNIWDFKDVNAVRVTNTDGLVREGIIISMVEREDFEDLGADNPDDTISIENDNGIYSFRASEIAEIVPLDEVVGISPVAPFEAGARRTG